MKLPRHQKFLTLSVLGIAMLSLAALGRSLRPQTSGQIISFTAGTPALAADVNQNFDFLDTGVVSNSANITLNTTAIASNAASISGIDESVISPDSLTAAELAPNAVGQSELQSDSVIGSKVADGSLMGADVSTTSGLVTHVVSGVALIADNSANSGDIFRCQNLAGVPDIEFRVDSISGDAFCDGTFTGGGADFAEMVAVSTGGTSVEPGDLMVIDVANPRAIVRSMESRSTLVCGVFSTQPGFLASERQWDSGVEPGTPNAGVAPLASSESSEPEVYDRRHMLELYDEIPLAVVGIVPCKVSAENGAIRPGDLLVTSSFPGHAMRDDNPRPGTIVGKALGSLDVGTGLIKVLVTLQ